MYLILHNIIAIYQKLSINQYSRSHYYNMLRIVTWACDAELLFKNNYFYFK